MAASMFPAYPPSLTPEQSEYLLSNIKDWSILHGLAVRPSQKFVPKELDPSRSLAVTAPVTLFPSLFPQACFEEARAIQTAYNELYAAIARDEDWLKDVVEELLEVDDFIKNLWDVHLAVKKEGYVQELSLGIFRSDYMIHKDPFQTNAKPEIKQVEFNTIASSFGGLATKVSALHRYLLSIQAFPATDPTLITPSSLPSDPSIDSIANGLATSHQAYGRSKSVPRLPLCILFIVQDPENNTFDQQAISFRLHSHHHITTFRQPFNSILAFTEVPFDDPSRPLIYHPPHSPSTTYEVSTLYFRAGYSPDEYTSPESWESRLHLERSAAIKCPSILTHLAGCKKIQQILATPSSPYLERFLRTTSSAAYIDRIRATFVAIYPLDDSVAGKKAIGIATDSAKSKGYVLKPQREGGGNNIYGAKIPPFLTSLGGDERKYRGHILMELIEPPALENSVFRNGEITSGGVIGELGVYGVCLWRNRTPANDEGAENSSTTPNDFDSFSIHIPKSKAKTVGRLGDIAPGQSGHHSQAYRRGTSGRARAASWSLAGKLLRSSKSQPASLWNPVNSSAVVNPPAKALPADVVKHPSRTKTVLQINTAENTLDLSELRLPKGPSQSSLQVNLSQPSSDPQSRDKSSSYLATSSARVANGKAPARTPIMSTTNTTLPLHSDTPSKRSPAHMKDLESNHPASPSTAQAPSNRAPSSHHSIKSGELPWNASHPCYPHPNPHLPLSSPLNSTTRIIRIPRDWMIAGDLAPTFSDTYPKILEPWVSEADFRQLIKGVNDGLVAAFSPYSWRAWTDVVLGVATGWFWEDLGGAGVKGGCKDVEAYMEEWNGLRRQGGEKDEDSDFATAIPLRRTGYLCLDIQIPDPHVGVVASSRGSAAEAEGDVKP